MGIFMNHQRQTGGFTTQIMPCTFHMWHLRVAFLCCMNWVLWEGLKYILLIIAWHCQDVQHLA